MKKWLLLLIIGVLLIGIFGGCASEPPIAYLSVEQVISRVQVYGVPSFPSFGSTPYSVGQWAAVYEGEGKWRVQGGVALQSTGETYYQTTWIVTQDKIKLISKVVRPKISSWTSDWLRE